MTSRALRLITAVLVLDFAVSLYLALLPAPRPYIHSLYRGAGLDVTCSETFAVYSPDDKYTYMHSCVLAPDRTLEQYRNYFESLDPKYDLRERVAFRVGKTLIHELVFSTDRRALVTTGQGHPSTITIFHLVPKESSRDGRAPVLR